MAADYRCKTLNPDNPEGPRIDAVFPADLTQRLYKFSPVRFKNLVAAKYVLERPERIFAGIREHQQGGWCFVARPSSWFIREDVEAPFPEDKVFAVYLNPRFHVFEHRAEPKADDDPMSPVDWRDRFGGLRWKSTS